MRRLAAVSGLALCLAASPAFAQATGSSSSQGQPTSTQKPAPPKPQAPPKPKVPRKPVGFEVFGAFDLERAAASGAFNAVTGSSWLFGFGGGANITNVWRELFIRGGLAFARTSGQRANVVNGIPIETGFPVDIAQRTIEIGGGWRFGGNNPKAEYYIGGGFIFLGHKETSDFAEPEENVDESLSGFYATAGFHYLFNPRVFLGIEGQWRSVAAPTPLGGAMAQFGEDNLGGIVARVMIGVRIK